MGIAMAKSGEAGNHICKIAYFYASYKLFTSFEDI